MNACLVICAKSNFCIFDFYQITEIKNVFSGQPADPLAAWRSSTDPGGSADHRLKTAALESGFFNHSV